VGLTALNFAQNSLGSRISNSLAKLLVSLPNLRNLNLSDCSLTKHLFHLAKQELAPAFSSKTPFKISLHLNISVSEIQLVYNFFKESKLEDINISYNNLGEIGMEALLLSLNPTRLTSLNCNSVGLKQGDDAFARILANFFQKNEDCCYLKALHLSDCGLSDHSLRLVLL
jgi:Ran GTPase-activating protein (RanGAP) involved in mRNA processing and transport